MLDKKVTIYLSAITELKLFSYSGLTKSEEQLIEFLLGTLSVIALDSKVARIAAGIRQKYRTKIADSAIAATALFTGTTLLTRNVKDFKKISGLSLKKI